MTKNNQLKNNLIKYYYINKNESLKSIAKRFSTRTTSISSTLREMGVDVVRDIHLKCRLQLGFHLHHRVCIPFIQSAKLANVSINALRDFFDSKSVRMRPSSYEKLSTERQELFRLKWKGSFVYKPKKMFKIPQEYSNTISQKMGDDILEYYRGGYTVKEMHSKNLVPISRKTISNFLKYNNVSVKQGSEYTKRYTVNETFFDSVDTEERAYWLGFIMGDGCISGDDGRENWTLSIGLQASDKDQLLRFKESIGATNPISEYLVAEKYPTCSIHICSTPLVQGLKKHGITSNKSLTACFPQNLQKQLIPHFVRGLFDADGSIPYSNGKPMGVSLCGTPELISEIMEKLSINSKYLYVRDDLNNFGELRCHKRREAIRILDYIYKDATIYMNRKYTRYKNLKKHQLAKV